MRESANSQDIQRAGGFKQTVGILQKVARIFGHRLLKTVAGSRIAVSRRYNDDDIQFSDKFVERGCPGPDLAAIVGTFRIAESDDEDTTAKAGVQGRNRFPHLRG